MPTTPESYGRPPAPRRPAQAPFNQAGTGSAPRPLAPVGMPQQAQQGLDQARQSPGFANMPSMPPGMPFGGQRPMPAGPMPMMPPSGGPPSAFPGQANGGQFPGPMPFPGGGGRPPMPQMPPQHSQPMPMPQMQPQAFQGGGGPDPRARAMERMQGLNLPPEMLQRIMASMGGR
jgi:hypothetical protein